MPLQVLSPSYKAEMKKDFSVRGLLRPSERPLGTSYKPHKGFSIVSYYGFLEA